MEACYTGFVGRNFGCSGPGWLLEARNSGLRRLNRCCCWRSGGTFAASLSYLRRVLRILCSW